MCMHCYICCKSVDVSILYVCVQVVLPDNGKGHSPGLDFGQPIVVGCNMQVPEQSLPQVNTQA